MEAQVTIQLSEQGQRDALARGLPATREQTILVPACNGDLKYFTVDNRGALSLALHSSASAVWTYRGWQDLTWDTYPSAEDILNFLRKRDITRAEIKAARQLESEQKDADERTRRTAAYVKFCALSEDEQESLISINYPERVYIDNVTLYTSSDYPAIAAAGERKRRRIALATEKAERKKHIPSAPVKRQTELAEDGQFSFTVPSGRYSNDWAKQVTAVNATLQGGYALLGPWLTCGKTIRLAVGDIIAVGSKEWQGSKRRGSYVTDYAVYVVTPVFLARSFTGQSVEIKATADLLALTHDERIEQALRVIVSSSDTYITDLNALDRSQFDSEETRLIDERLTAWRERKTLAERALLCGRSAGEFGATETNNRTDRR